MLNKLTILFFLSSRLIETCEEGCLKCSSDSKCLICDLHNFFILNTQNKCEKKVIENCEKIDIYGNCQLCKTQYYPNNNQCVQILQSNNGESQNNLVSSCVYYISQKTCSLCGESYYLNGGICQKANTIANCQYNYISKSECNQCKKNYIRSIDRKFCNQVQSSDNCKTKSYVSCRKCKTGFFLNKNNYLIESLNETKQDFSNFVKIKKIVEQVHNQQGESYWSQCTEVQVKNCALLKNYKECLECLSGYYLGDKNLCYENPQDQIPHCEIYSDQNTCQQCQNKYYTSQQLNCEKHIDILFCEVYSKTQKNVCDQCSTDYYSAGDQCIKRDTNTVISNCKQLSYTNNICQECEFNYETNVNGTFCLEKIQFCVEYQKTEISLTCQKCEERYFLENNICFVGNIENCQVYSSRTKCKTCQNKYYLSNDICSLHPLIDELKCTTSSSEILNKCELCTDDRVRIQLNKYCSPISQLISNCEIYKDAYNCEKCKSNVSYLVVNECKLGQIDKCTKYNVIKNQCEECLMDFDNNQAYVTYPKNIENNQCQKANPNLDINCFEMGLSADEAKCKVCNQQYYFYQFDTLKNFYCVPNDFYELGSSENVDSCLLFDKIKKMCLRCDKGFFISSSGKCVNSCDPTELAVLNSFVQYIELSQFTSNSEENYMQFYMQCVPRSNSSYQFNNDEWFNPQFNVCEVVLKQQFLKSNNIFVTKNLCLQCKEDMVGMIKNSYKTTLSDYRNQTYQVNFYHNTDYLKIQKIVKRHPYNYILSITSCLSKQITDIGQTTSSQTLVARYKESAQSSNLIPASLENCKFSKEIANTGRYGCVACEHGYSGQIVKNYDQAEGSLVDVFINKCTRITQCISSVYYYGISRNSFNKTTITKFPRSFFISCHKCLNGDIPTIALTPVFATQTQEQIDNNEYPPDAFIEYYMYPFRLNLGKNEMPFQNVTQSENLTSCQANGLGQGEIFNCAIQEVNIVEKLSTQNTINTIVPGNPFCLACQPGYLPVYLDNSTKQYAMKESEKNQVNYVVSCDIILHCDLQRSQTVDRCDVCTGVYSLMYNTNFGVNQDVFSMSEGLKCILSNMTNCLVYQEASGTTPGECKLCDKGYVLNQDKICDKVELYQCQEYGMMNEMTYQVANLYGFFGMGCLECNEGYVGIKLETKHNQCINSSQIISGKFSENSIIIISNCRNYGPHSSDALQNICVECNAGYNLSYDQKKCFRELSTLNNCLYYDLSGVLCGKCNEGFYVNSQGLCSPGSIENCIQYESEFSCLVCEDDFLAIKISATKKVCLEKPSLNCKNFDESELENSKLLCTQCEKDYYINDNQLELGILPLYYCINVPNIPNCIKYNNYPDIQQADLSCLECESDYYLNQLKQCVRRENNNISRCIKKSIDSDTCAQCEDLYYVNEGICKKYPFGIVDCEIYDFKLRCIKCKPYTYLQDEVCNKIEQAKLIPNCLYYNEFQNCEECVDNYFKITVQNCIEAKATNCASYIDQNNCKTCKSGFGLKEITSGIQCVKIEIENCYEPVEVTTPTEEEFKCKKCNISFYLNENGACVAVPVNIYGCLFYSSKDKCSQCIEGMVITKTGQCSNDATLTEYYDSNCLINQEETDPLCNMCNPRYKFKSDDSEVCEKCSDQQGCLLCDVENTSNFQGNCLVCQSGYYMDKDEKCIQISNQTTQTIVKKISITVVFLYNIFLLF